MILSLLRHALLFGGIGFVFFFAIRLGCRWYFSRAGSELSELSKLAWLKVAGLLTGIGLFAQLIFGLAGPAHGWSRPLILAAVGIAIARIAQLCTPYLLRRRAYVLAFFAGAVSGATFPVILHGLSEGVARTLVLGLYGLAIALSIEPPQGEARGWKKIAFREVVAPPRRMAQPPRFLTRAGKGRG